MWKPVSNLYTIVVVMFAWVLFRSETLSGAIDFWKAMFRFEVSNQQIGIFLDYMNSEFYIALVIALLGAFGFFRHIGNKIELYLTSERAGVNAFAYSFHIVSALFYASILIICSMYLIVGTYNPFIYYRF